MPGRISPQEVRGGWAGAGWGGRFDPRGRGAWQALVSEVQFGDR